MKNEPRPHYIWRSMRGRCLNPNTKSWYIYGGRWITVCKKWLDFDGFWSDMKDGYADHLQIDRINNDKGYNKKNCRWVTVIQQARNRRTNRPIKTHLGTILIPEATEKTSINAQTIRWRVYNGWPEDKLLTAPRTHKHNTERNHFVNTPSGRITLKAAEKLYDISESLLRYRLRKNWPQENLLQRPKGR